MSSQLHVVVIGNGMVGHHLLEQLAPRRRARARLDVTVIGEEPRLAYDRVNLSKFFEGKTAADLSLASAEEYAARRLRGAAGRRRRGHRPRRPDRCAPPRAA